LPFEQEAAPLIREQGIHISFAGRERHTAVIPAPHVLVEVPEHSDPEGSEENLVIEGDNIDAMASLMAQYSGQVDVCLTDPPYGGDRTNLRYEDGNTGWLNQMLPTFHVIHELLADTGVLFVHIDDDNLFSLGMLLDDIFDRKNRLGVIVWKGAHANQATHIAQEHEYVLCYAKNREALPKQWRGAVSADRQRLLNAYEDIVSKASTPEEISRQWSSFMRESAKQLNPGLAAFKRVDARGPFYGGDLGAIGKASSYGYDVLHPATGRPCKKPLRNWNCTEETMRRYLDEKRVLFGRDETTVPQFKRYLDEGGAESLRSVIDLDSRSSSATMRRLFPENPGVFQNPKPVEIEEHLLSFVAAKDALILDPFAGSGTTGHAVMRLNKRDGGERRFILVERGVSDDRYATALTAERIRRARAKDGLPGGFTFLRVGDELNAEAWERLRREEIIRVIRQADPSGRGRGIRRIEGDWVIGANSRKQAICLAWSAEGESAVSREILAAMFEEVATLGLRLPMRVYGTTCEVAETDDFTFCQLPDEVRVLLGLRAPATAEPKG
jgi:adenine-specific DNA-methyltransferase